MSTEIDHLMACGAELGHQLFLQTKPTVIGGWFPPAWTTQKSSGGLLELPVALDQGVR
jgi:hypothetical protein